MILNVLLNIAALWVALIIFFSIIIIRNRTDDSLKMRIKILNGLGLLAGSGLIIVMIVGSVATGPDFAMLSGWEKIYTTAIGILGLAIIALGAIHYDPLHGY